MYIKEKEDKSFHKYITFLQSRTHQADNMFKV